MLGSVAVASSEARVILCVAWSRVSLSPDEARAFAQGGREREGVAMATLRQRQKAAKHHVEWWHARLREVTHEGCGVYTVPEDHSACCPSCGSEDTSSVLLDKAGWCWWTCLPGCLPDSDVSGPFDTETDCLNDALGRV